MTTRLLSDRHTPAPQAGHVRAHRQARLALESQHRYQEGHVPCLPGLLALRSWVSRTSCAAPAEGGGQRHRGTDSSTSATILPTPIVEELEKQTYRGSGVLRAAIECREPEVRDLRPQQTTGRLQMLGIGECRPGVSNSLTFLPYFPNATTGLT